jgi:hypothetical protein
MQLFLKRKGLHYYSMKIKLLLIVTCFIGFLQLNAQCVFSAPKTACVNEPITLSANLSTLDRVKWDINGEIVNDIKNPSYVFKTSGLKYIKMYVTDENGNKCFYQSFVEVNKKPILNFRALPRSSNLCNNLNYCFVDSSTSGELGGKIYKREFIFDDNSKKEVFGDGVVNFCQSFPNINGAVIGVTIKITDNNGCVTAERISNLIKFEKLVVPSFTSNRPMSCNSVTMCLQNKSEIALEDVQSFVWKWGDGTESRGTKDSVALWGVNGVCRRFVTQGPNAGNFNTKLIVHADFGCSDSFEYKNSATLYVIKNKIIASKDSVCSSDGLISFRLRDTIYQGSNPVFNFGNPSSGSLNVSRKWRTSHRYTKPGAYKINFSFSHPNVACVTALYDTILVIGPQTIIDEHPNTLIEASQRFQPLIKDTVRFANSSLFFHNDNDFTDDDSVVVIAKDSVLVNKLSGQVLDPNTVVFNASIHEWVKSGFNAPLNHSFNNRPTGQVSLNPRNQRKGNSHVIRTWDFDDDYCEPCTTDIKLGINTDKNCRFSKDSTPQHWYTPWEQIYAQKFSNKAVLISYFNTDSGRLETKKLWASDSMAIIRDTVLFYGDNAKGRRAKDSLLFSTLNSKIKINGTVVGPYQSTFERESVLYVNALDSVFANKNDGNGWVQLVGPNYYTLKKGDQIKIPSNKHQFLNVFQLAYSEDTVSLNLLENGRKVVKFLKNNVGSNDSINAAMHRRLFYESNTVKCFQVKLMQFDTQHPLACKDEKTVTLSLQPPTMPTLRKEGVQCFGGGEKEGITFILDDRKANCSFTWAELNVDTSLNKKAWIPLVSPNLTAGGMSMGDLPPTNSPYFGYKFSGKPSHRYSKQFIETQIKDTISGYINVGLIIGRGQWENNLNNGINTNTYGYPSEFIDTVYFNKFARFPILDNKFRIVRSKEGQEYTKVCRKDTICLTTNVWNRTYVPDVEESQWSITGANVGRNYNQYYNLTVTEKYDRLKEVAGNPNVLEDYLTVTKEQFFDGVTTVLSKQVIKIAVNTKWHVEADVSAVFDLLKEKFESNGVSIYDLSPTQLNAMIWNGVGVINKPYTGSKGFIDTTGFGHLIKFKKVADEKTSLHFRDTSIVPIDKAKGWDNKTYNAYCFVPQYSGYYVANFSLRSHSPERCVKATNTAKKILVGFYSKLTFTDTVIHPGVSMSMTPSFRYFETYPEIAFRLLDPNDYWRNRITEAGNPGREMVTRTDLSKEDDGLLPRSVFGGFPFSTSGLGNPTVTLGGNQIPGSLYYNLDSGRVYTLRVATGDSSGCLDTFSQKIYTVYADVDFEVNTTTGFCKREVEFRNNTVLEDPYLQEFGKPGIKVVKSEIDWGDGQKTEYIDSMPDVVKHSYSENFMYKIKFKVYSQNTLNNEIVVRDTHRMIEFNGPLAFFDTMISRYYFVNDEVKFENLSRYRWSDSIIWLWDMGDGNIITQRDTLTGAGLFITHRYQKQGRYPVTLYMYERHKGNIQVCSYQYPSVNYYTKGKFFITIVDSNVTSIQRLFSKSSYFDIRVIPNPNSGQFKVKLLNQQTEKFNLIIRDLSGKVVYEKQVNNKEEDCSVNVDFLTKGLYFVTIDNQQEQVTHKLIIQ